MTAPTPPEQTRLGDEGFTLFTVGPWSQMETEATIDDNASWSSDVDVDIDDNQRMNTWVGIGNPELTNGIVAIAVFNGYHDDPRFDANIRLIAAAPDLFAVVQQYVSDLRYPPQGDSIQRRIDAAEAVLAKAGATS